MSGYFLLLFLIIIFFIIYQNSHRKNYQHMTVKIEKSIHPKNKLEYLQTKLKQLIPEAKKHYKTVTGEETEMPDDIRLRIKDLKDSAGTYHPPQFDYRLNTFVEYGLITIDKDSLKDSEYAEIVLKHELVHALFNQTDHEEAHHKEFREVASLMNIPPKFQD